MANEAPSSAYFLKEFLSKPVGSIPRVPIWSLTFDNIPTSLILKVNDYQSNICNPPPDAAVLSKLTTGALQDSKGCLFVQGIDLPGDGFTSNAEGSQQGGLFREYMNSGREDLQKFKVSFLDTSISFVEHVIRPWVIMSSFMGMVARKEQYRAGINIFRWGLGTKDSSSPVVYQTWKFKGVIPVSVDSEKIEYTQQSGVLRRNVDFVYQSYEYNPSPKNIQTFLV